MGFEWRWESLRGENVRRGDEGNGELREWSTVFVDDSVNDR